MDMFNCFLTVRILRHVPILKLIKNNISVRNMHFGVAYSHHTYNYLFTFYLFIIFRVLSNWPKTECA